MRIVEFKVSNKPPIANFHSSDLTSRVVIAGPNGVGKTRLNQALIELFRDPKPNADNYLVIEATSKTEIDSWKKKRLTTTDKDDCALLRNILHAIRRRKNWRSSIVLIESNRSIRNYNQLQYTFEISDPDEENIGWDYTFQPLNSRWNDTQQAIFKKIIAQRNALGSQAIQLKKEGREVMGLHFEDPLQPFREAFTSLLGPKVLAQPDIQNQKLRYTQGGQTLDVSTLSSGEQQVLNITFDIILRSPSDCIFIVDEPELHLHPELSHKLIRTLQNIGENNQFIFFSHSADIISSSIDDTVVFMRPATDGDNQAVRAGRDDDATSGLRLLGHSIGVISLGKRIVLIEGEESSTDKKVYGNILGSGANDFVLLPVGNVQTLHNFENIREKVLDKSIWGVEFFMLCDHDAPYPDDIDENNFDYPRLRRIKRYHIENYFLEEEIFSEVFKEMDTEELWLHDKTKIREQLVALAEQKLAYTTALIVARHIWRKSGYVKVIPKGCDGADKPSLIALMSDMAKSEVGRFSKILNPEYIENLTSTTFDKLEKSLADDSWKNLIPGRPILRSFLNKAGLREAHIKTLYIKRAITHPKNPFGDVFEVFDYFRGISHS